MTNHTDHEFFQSPLNGEWLPCSECGVDGSTLDPEEEDYWRALLAWVDAQ